MSFEKLSAAECADRLEIYRENECANCIHHICHSCNGACKSVAPLDYAASILRKYAAGELVEVVHARWENIPGEIIHWCSACHQEPYHAEHGYEILSKCCPNCGAKMDEKDGEQG